MFKAKLNQGGLLLDVAVKVLKSQEGEEEFLKEEANIKELSHDNIVKYYGHCTAEGKQMLITEFLPLGDLRQYLRKHRENRLPQSSLLVFAYQIAFGMMALVCKIHSTLKIRGLCIRIFCHRNKGVLYIEI